MFFYTITTFFAISIDFFHQKHKAASACLGTGALQRIGKGSDRDALLLRFIEERLAHRLNVNRNPAQTALLRLRKE